MSQEKELFSAWVEELKTLHPTYTKYIDAQGEEMRSKLMSVLRTAKTVKDNYYVSMVKFAYRSLGTANEKQCIQVAAKSVQGFDQTVAESGIGTEMFPLPPTTFDELIRGLLKRYGGNQLPMGAPDPSDSDIMAVLQALYDGSLEFKKTNHLFPSPMCGGTGYLFCLRLNWEQYVNGLVTYESFKKSALDRILK